MATHPLPGRLADRPRDRGRRARHRAECIALASLREVCVRRRGHGPALRERRGAAQVRGSEGLTDWGGAHGVAVDIAVDPDSAGEGLRRGSDTHESLRLRSKPRLAMKPRLRSVALRRAERVGPCGSNRVSCLTAHLIRRMRGERWRNRHSFAVRESSSGTALLATSHSDHPAPILSILDGRRLQEPFGFSDECLGHGDGAIDRRELDDEALDAFDVRVEF